MVVAVNEDTNPDTLLPRPRRNRRKDHAARGKTDPQLRSQAIELAADMEMGYYVSLDGSQWPVRPFVIEEIIERSGYSRDRARKGTRPVWWPGTDAFRRMVSLKVLLRQAQRTPIDSEVPWLDAALALSTEELLRRLVEEPSKINSRELVDFTTKVSRMREERRGRGDGASKNVGGNTLVFQNITQTIQELPPEEQEHARALYERAIESARKALPATVEVMPS